MTLYEETPCEHGFVTKHDGYSSKPLEAGDWGGQGIDPTFVCPGGSRREVAVDYEAGAKVRRRIVRCLCSVNHRFRDAKHVSVAEQLGEWMDTTPWVQEVIRDGEEDRP